MRAWSVLVILLLAGCTSPAPAAYEPPPFDVPAPPPREVPEVEFIEPPKGLDQIIIQGRILDPLGKPIHGALVWVEGTDLRQPVNNMAEYLERREETLVRTDVQGRYRFVLDDGFYHLTAYLPGFYLNRFQPDVRAKETTHDVTMWPAQVHLVGHRGAYYYAPENTAASLVKARWLGIDLVEVDVRLSSDGVPVILHDQTLERTTGDTRRVYDVPFEELTRMDVGAWFGADFSGERIMSLDEVYDLARNEGVRLVLDVKGMLMGEPIVSSTYEAILDRIEARGMQEYVIFASFHNKAVTMCVERGSVYCAWMTNDETMHRNSIRHTADLGADMVMLRRTMVDLQVLQEAAQRGVEVHVWGLNRPEDWARMLGLGVTSWGTDRPGYVLDYLNG